MNARPHAIATALANAVPLASFSESVSAKEREGKGHHRTTPNGVFRVAPSPSIVTSLTREAANEMDVAPRFNGGQR